MVLCLSSVSIIFSIDFGFSGKSSSLFSDHEIYVFMKVSLKKELKEISNDQVFPIKKIFKVLLPIVEYYNFDLVLGSPSGNRPQLTTQSLLSVEPVLVEYFFDFQASI